MENAFEATVFGNEWLIFALVASVVFAIAEMGYRAGLRLFRARDEARRNQIGGIQAAVLGLLGLLLGFTFSMGVNRYETRRDFVLREANAIGTTYLRSGFLPEAHQEPVKELLRQYLDVRLQTRSSARDVRALSEGLRRSQELQNALWQHVEAAAKESPTPLTATFVTALNEMIDTDAARVAAARNEIPAGVWLLLVFVAAAGCFVSSYGSGALGERSGFTNCLLPALLTIVITSIFDLTHSKQGFIEVSQQPLLDLQQSIAPQHK
jgi:hypothetical protein